MTLVTRFSAFFLVTLALVLGGFSACIFALMGIRLHQGLDRELATALDPHEAGGEPAVDRASWALFDETGHRLEGSADELGSRGATVYLESRLSLRDGPPFDFFSHNRDPHDLSGLRLGRVGSCSRRICSVVPGNRDQGG